MNPPTANAMSLARAGDTVIADAASSFSRTPTIMRPMPVRLQVPDEQQHDDEDDEHEVVVGAVPVRELERSDVGARDLRRSEQPAVKNGRSKRYTCAAIANASVLIASSRPRTRSAPMPTITATRLAKLAPSSSAHGNEMPGDRPVDDPRVVPADVELQAADQRGGGERTEAGERHLPERELTAPPGEHDHRDRAEREGDDRSPTSGDAPTCRTATGSDHRGEQRQAGDELREPFAPTRCRAAVRGSRRSAARTGSSRRSTPCRAGSPRATSTSTARNSTNCTRPVSARVVEEEHAVEDADDDRRRARRAGTTPSRRSARRPCRAAACRARCARGRPTPGRWR